MVFLIVWFISAYVTFVLATTKGRSVGPWISAAFVFGPLIPLILYQLPSLRDKKNEITIYS